MSQWFAHAGKFDTNRFGTWATHQPTLHVNQHRKRTCWCPSIISPGVSRVPLDEHVPGLERDLLNVKEQHDLSAQHEEIINRSGSVKPPAVLQGWLGIRRWLEMCKEYTCPTSWRIGVGSRRRQELHGVSRTKNTNGIGRARGPEVALADHLVTDHTRLGLRVVAGDHATKPGNSLGGCRVHWQPVPPRQGLPPKRQRR